MLQIILLTKFWNIHNNGLWFCLSVRPHEMTSASAANGPTLFKNSDDKTRYILHTIRSVYPPHGQWPAPMGSWRVKYSRKILNVHSSAYGSISINFDNAELLADSSYSRNHCIINIIVVYCIILIIRWFPSCPCHRLPFLRHMLPTNQH